MSSEHLAIIATFGPFLWTALVVAGLHLWERQCRRARAARRGDPPTPAGPHGIPPEPPVDDLVRAHLAMRDLEIRWQYTERLWFLYGPDYPYGGFSVWVDEHASRYQWLNAMDAARCGRHLHSELEPDIVSPQNTPAAAASELTAKTII